MYGIVDSVTILVKLKFLMCMPIQLMLIGLKTREDFKQKTPDTEESQNQTWIVDSNIHLFFGSLLLLD